jgi:hypothetical protein
MAETTTNKPTEAALPYRFFFDGVTRLTELMNDRPFNFVVNGRLFESSLGEAVLLSPKVHQLIKNDQTTPSMIIKNQKINCDDFSKVQACVRGFSIEFDLDSQASLMSLCDELGNSNLISLFASVWSSSSSSVLIDCRRGFDLTVDAIASKFCSYSKSESTVLGYEVLDCVLSSDSLRLGSEDWLLQMIENLGEAYRSLVRHVRVEYLTSVGIVNFVKSITAQDIDEVIWKSIGARLCGIVDESARRHHFVDLFSGSTIQSLLRNNIPVIFAELADKRFELLYRGSRDGFKIAEFHRRCDGRRDTITVIESKGGNVFGGHTPLPWSSSAGYQTDSSLKTFLFTLKNPHGISPRKFMVKNGGVKAIYCTGDRLAFGAEHSLCIWDNCTERTDNHVHFGNSFENDTGLNPPTLLNGTETFAVQEIEIFAPIE